MVINESILEQQKRSAKSKRYFLVYIFILISILLSIASLNYAGYYVVIVDGRSMQNTLQDGDKLVARATTDVDYGDIIIISVKDGTGTKRLIKRVIGLAGDEIELTVVDGVYRVKRNGNLLDEPYAVGQTAPIGSKSSWIVPENEVFFLGDNRENSGDSRYNVYGTQSISNIEGVVCNWSISLKGLNNVILFWMKEGA